MHKFFFKLFLFAAIFVTSLYGSSFGCSSNCLGSGFLIGGYGAFHAFVFHTKDSAFDGGPEEGFWEYDAVQRAPGGGGFIGYGIPFCERFILAFKVSASGFSSEAQHSYFDTNPLYSYPNKMRVKYIVDLSLEPGAHIGSRLFLYVKLGASNVGWRQTRQILLELIPTPIVGQDKQHFNNWGFVFGAGAQTLITKCVSAFVEFDGHSYPLNNSIRRVDNSDDLASFLEYRLTRLYGYGFRFGLMTQF